MFKNYQQDYYEKVIDFLKEINKEDKTHINWNWARFEWMMYHPYFKKEDMASIGLWFDDDRVVGAAIFDMYFGECSCLTLKGYESLYEEVINYAYKYLQDDNGLSIAVNDEDKDAIDLVTKNDFKKVEQKETLMSISLDKVFDDRLIDGLSFYELDPEKEPYDFQWVIFQGFDHGDNVEEFKKDYIDFKEYRPHYNPRLNMSVINEKGEKVAFCSLWYLKDTDYAYLEPLCVIPSYRNKGVAKALVNHLLNIVKEMGAKEVYVISDMEFYSKLGFKISEKYSFYWRKKEIFVNNKKYFVNRLLGKGKGGYSYLASNNEQKVVLKQIHHEPCSYYQFGNKIEAENRDYHRLLEAGIRIPKMIDIDIENERIIKEYIDGPTIFDLVKEDKDVSRYIEQVIEMAKLAKNAGINIDYFPTNFVVFNDELYYIDYECNDYMDEWNFQNWGIKYWSKTKEFLDYLKEHD